MTDPAADAARSAAAILASDLGPNLPAEVEADPAARDTQQCSGQYLDPVSLASLIVERSAEAVRVTSTCRRPARVTA